MESILNMIVNADNVRMLVLLAFGYVYLTRFRTSFEKRMDGLDRKIDGVEVSLNKKIDGVEASIKELKYNDFAHLNATVIALTYALEKTVPLKGKTRNS